MKKILLTLTAALMTVFIIASDVQATFNSPGAMPTITVTNASTNPCSLGAIDGCWQQSATAQPGDVIAVHVYYKNTGSQPEQAYIDLKPSRSGANVQFTGGVNNAGGIAHVTLSTATTIAYLTGVDRACWMPYESSGCREVNADALFGNGFNIGVVNPGEQGVLVARFLVGAGTATPTPDTDRPQCDDDIDNDGDGRIDYPSDIGCSSYNDDSEYNAAPSVDECVIDSFTASDYSIEEGDSTTLRWDTTDCDYVRITSVTGNLNENGSTVVRPASDKTYTLTAYPGGDTKTVHISVDEVTDDQDDACTIEDFRSNRYSIERGQTATITWRVVDADRVEINGSTKSKSGTMSVSPHSTTTYRINVSGNGCSDTESFSITVGDQENARPQAITTVASILSTRAAQLNGIAVPNTTSGTTSAWFEWGPSTTVQYRTVSKVVGTGSSSIPYSDTVSGLVAGTTYYYRAAVQNQNGIAYGDIVPFRTQSVVAGSTVVTKPHRVVVQTQTTRDSVTTQSAPSLLELRVESAYDHMCINGELEYVVTYRNISSVTLEDTVLRIALPKELTYAGADRGSFDPIDNILTLDIGRVQPGQEGTVTVRTRVNANAIRGNLTVMTATVVYTNPITRAQEDAIAYSLITVSDECPTVLGASVFGFGSFLPNTLLEWLLLILVILALILLGRNLYKKREEQK